MENKELVDVAVFAIANEHTKVALLDILSGVLDCSDESLLNQASELMKKLTENLQQVVEHESITPNIHSASDSTIATHLFRNVPVVDGKDICALFTERLTNINCRGVCLVIKNDSVSKIASTRDVGKRDYENISWVFTDMDILSEENYLNFHYMSNAFKGTLL